MDINKEHVDDHETSEALTTSDRNCGPTLSENKLKPFFGWYQPQLGRLNAKNTVRSEPGDQGSCQADYDSERFFFDSTRKMLADEVARRKDERHNSKSADKLRKEPKTTTVNTDDDFEKLFAPLGHATPIEDLFWGPPLSKKLPPATDYERLLND
ncbi:unnamed protein product [Phytomonas sp. Hart1]|nr:unnamed protein product [Phytomonas sp. Hart1]|eukprot:CCW66470.1 unnamed protein product [Phytomonas sp. isolate Hart1]